jgi:hypothetical protein
LEAKRRGKERLASPAFELTRGNEINTAMRSNALLTCRLAVF